MSTVLLPTWKDFDGIVSSARQCLLVCTPFFSEDGLGRLFDQISGTPSVDFWTRLSIMDWIGGFSAPEELLAFINLWSEAGSRIDLSIFQRLHAKIYAADGQLVMVGSSNLTNGGFGGNLEVMASFEGVEAATVLTQLQNECKPFLRQLSMAELEQWIQIAKPAVRSAQSKINADEQDPALSRAQEELDKLLGYGGGGAPVPPRENDFSSALLDDFVKWLRQNTGLAGAAVLLVRHDNSHTQNLQGHVKQCFAGSLRFLTDQPQFRPLLASLITSKGTDYIYPLDDYAIRDSWCTYLDDHALESGDWYRFATLRLILPPRLGGSREGGGGGSSTLQRMLPLVATYLNSRSQD